VDEWIYAMVSFAFRDNSLAYAHRIFRRIYPLLHFNDRAQKMVLKEAGFSEADFSMAMVAHQGSETIQRLIQQMQVKWDSHKYFRLNICIPYIPLNDDIPFINAVFEYGRV
jgi:hypothetical protein